MKLKELKRTVNVSWSPEAHYPVALAAGAAAQQVDATFNSSSYLELYSLNLEDSGPDLELKSSIQTEHKFQKIVWSGANVIVGGCDGGLLQFYSVDKLLAGSTDALLGSNTKHSGNVSALDINPYQKNLLASGASESEIFIWDLNNTAQPMAPGNRSQPHDHVQGLAWNQQVQHILGSTFSSRCVVWDLRKNEPIMKLSDSQSRTRWRALAWHPSVATQLCLASEDDQVPVVQLWDLRLAASPLVTLEGHHKGVSSLSWSRHDPDLLLSAGRDGRILCWNPNQTTPGGSLLAELCAGGAWVCDVAWSARVPALFASTSFDQQLGVYSLYGGSRAESSPQSQSNIMESFGGADSFSQLPAVPRAAPAAPHAPQLPHPPCWLKRPAAAAFSFGGKLVTFARGAAEAGARVVVSQVVSEPDVVERAAELDGVLGNTLSHEPDAAERLAEYCLSRGDAAADQQERYMWFFLRASFLPNFRSEALNLLGFKQDDMPSKFKSQPASDAAPADTAGLSRGESTETEAELSTDTSTDLSDAQTLIERKLDNIELEPAASNISIPAGEEPAALICRALVCGHFEEAVELCLEAKRVADALVIASLGSPELVLKVQKYHLKQTAADPVSLLAGSALAGRWAALVGGAAARSWKHTLAAILTHTDGDALAHFCEMLGDKLSQESDPSLSEAASICYLVGMAPDQLVSRWNRTRTAADVDSLSTVTTLALLARRAAIQRNRQIQPGGKLEAIVQQYASRLAAQGCLQSALRTLEGVQHTELRERLQHALGMRHTDTRQSQQPLSSRARTVSAHSQKRGHVLHSDVTSAYGTAPSDNQWGQSSVAAPAYQPRGFQPPQPQPLQPQPLQPLQPQPLQPQPSQPQPQPPHIPALPPRPPSVGSQSGGITSRSKYKVDPSVQSAPNYNNYSFNNPVTSQPSYGYNSPVPDQYLNSSVSNFSPINPANPGNPGLNPMNPGLNGVNPMNPVNPGLNPAVNGGYYTPQAAVEAIPPPAASRPAAPGWNDPPMPSKLKPKQEVVNQAPITHPLFGAEPPQHVPLNPAGYPGQTAQYPGQTAQYPGQTAQYPGQTAQYPGQTGQYPGQTGQYPGQTEQYPGQQAQYPGQFDQHSQYQQNTSDYTQQPEPPAAAPSPAPPVQKAPLPAEHVVLQSVFDDIRAECSARAANPQMKRKLEEVQRRLETLYDLLREYKLSDSALVSLHASAAQARARDFGAALGAVTSLAQGADFAQAAAFLPALKGLLQLAAQLLHAS